MLKSFLRSFRFKKEGCCLNGTDVSHLSVPDMQQVKRRQRDKKTIVMKEKCSTQTPLFCMILIAIVLLVNAEN